MLNRFVDYLARLFLRAGLGVLVLLLTHVARAQPAGDLATNRLSELIEFSGRVEVLSAGKVDWTPAQTNQVLQVGDRLRTGAESRATLQLSDRSVVRMNQSTVLEILPASQPARHRFGLLHGIIFFWDRERPADVEFETPLATGAIRGTEFMLAVEGADAATRLALWDGGVELKTSAGMVKLTSGQEVWLQPGNPAQITAVLPVANLMQWSFYYPGVLNPAELKLADSERSPLARSIADYNAGDLLAALAESAGATNQLSGAAKNYLAALKLAVGQVDAAEALISDDESAQALRELIASVKFQPLPQMPLPATSSAWLARSYYLQSRSDLVGALASARQAVKLAPQFGFAWERVAELEFGFENRRAASLALEQARQLSPRNAQALALEGYIAVADNHPRAALGRFDQALQLDGSLPSAWLGRALAEAQLGRDESARRDLQVATTLEPQRGLFRTYMGKAWAQTGDDKLADKEFALAQKLDPADPTVWLYSALHRFQTHQVNEAVKDLEKSVDLNDNRSLFRSKLELDRDRAVRSADLAAIYDAAGMTEVSRRAASRAVEESYSDFGGHIFLSDSLSQQEDPQHYNLRYETARENELLLANLLAPPGGGNLSQLLSQQDRLQYFDQRLIGASSLTEYDSRGDWDQAATAFGSVGGFSYAFDGQYSYQNGDRPNDKFEDQQYSVQVKQQVTPSDSVYFQAAYFKGESGDVAQHFDPTNVLLSLHVTEEQSPNLYLGADHEWSPGSHTLVLLSRLTDRLSLTNPSPSVLFTPQDGGPPYGVTADPFFNLYQEEDFTLYSAEVQQIWETPHQALIVGGRYQYGTVDTHTILNRLFGFIEGQSASPYLERVTGYGYYLWHPISALHITAGLSYDDLTFPRNVDLPPIQSTEAGRSLLGPKAGFTVEPWAGGWLHGAWTRSLGGLFFDNSIRLEPSQVAGELSAFRSLIPEPVEGLVPGTKFDSYSLGFDQSLPSHTYFGVEAQFLKSDGSRDVGAFTNGIPFIPVPTGVSSASQTLEYQERNFSVYINQLLGRDVAVGSRYSASQGYLVTTLPELANARGVVAQEQNERALLQHGQWYLIYNHPCGFFAEWSTDWYHQENHGTASMMGVQDFWQHNLYAGYVFPHRRAEIRLGLLNLTDQDYRLNPLNLQSGLARGRTFTASLRLNF